MAYRIVLVVCKCQMFDISRLTVQVTVARLPMKLLCISAQWRHWRKSPSFCLNTKI